jgi:hypothetical protein
MKFAEGERLNSASLWESGEICRSLFQVGKRWPWSPERRACPWPECLGDDNEKVSAADRRTIRRAEALLVQLRIKLTSNGPSARANVPVRKPMESVKEASAPAPQGRLAGLLLELPRQQRDLVKAIYGMGKVTIAAVLKALFPPGWKGKNKSGAFSKAIVRTNRRLAESNLPCTIVRKAEVMWLAHIDTGEPWTPTGQK